MSRKPKRITEAEYRKVLAAYREQPGNKEAIAKLMGWGWRRARRAWEQGWPWQDPRFRPIRDVLAEEGNQAVLALRTAELKQMRQEKEASRSDGLQAQIAQIKAMRILRRSTVRAVELAEATLEQGDRLVERLVEMLEERAQDVDATPQEIADLLSQIMRFQSAAQRLAAQQMALEDKHKLTVDVVDSQGGKTVRTVDEAMAVYQRALDAKERFEARQKRKALKAAGGESDG